MGSLSVKSLELILERHGAELVRDVQPSPPGTRLVYVGTRLVYVGTVCENTPFVIGVEHEFRMEAGEPVFIAGQPFDSDILAKRFPDCKNDGEWWT